MKLPNEEYKKAEQLLKNYNYNCMNIMNIRADIMDIQMPNNNGMPKAAYNVSDTVLNKVIQLEENEELQKCIKQYKIVRQALELLDQDCKDVFEKLYQQKKSKWAIIDELGFSEETFKRRKRKLIYTVYEELKKSWPNVDLFFYIFRAILIVSKNIKHAFLLNAGNKEQQKK